MECVCRRMMLRIVLRDTNGMGLHLNGRAFRTRLVLIKNSRLVGAVKPLSLSAQNSWLRARPGSAERSNALCELVPICNSPPAGSASKNSGRAAPVRNRAYTMSTAHTHTHTKARSPTIAPMLCMQIAKCCHTPYKRSEDVVQCKERRMSLKCVRVSECERMCVVCAHHFGRFSWSSHVAVPKALRGI